MKILIVGAGLGGLTLRAFLQQEGVQADIIEKTETWDNQGYSLGMWDNGRDILAKLGLADRFDKHGEHIKKYVIKRGDGNTIRTYSLSDFYAKYGSGYTHINRDLVHSWLREKAGEESVRMSTTVHKLDQREEGVDVMFSDGTQNTYDLVVGADGVHSSIRSLVFGQDLERYEQWRAWFVWIDQRFEQERSVVQYMEPSQFVSIFDDGDKTLAVLLAPADHNEWDTEDGRIDRLCGVFSGCPALVPQMFHGISNNDITPTDLSVVRLKKWSKGRVALLGDAAHAMTPFGGVGGSMAMEDGYVLAGEIIKVQRQKQGLDDALAVYERKRRKRVSKARRATLHMRWWAMQRSKLLFSVCAFFVSFVPSRFVSKEFHKLMREEI